MARRKAAADASLFAMNLFDLMTGEDENTIVLDSTDDVVECLADINPSDDKSWMKDACFDLDGNNYRIKQVDTKNNTVVACDTQLTKLYNTDICQVFPIDKIEPFIQRKTHIPDVKAAQHEDNEPVSLIPTETLESKHERESVKPSPLPSLDFHYETSEEEYRTKGERVARNLKAIETVKRIESEKRSATPDEQVVLARFSGWGGLSDVFKENDSNYASVAKALTGREYKAASDSSLTAYYTPLSVIESIYMMLSNAGFKGGRVLEPSCGTGKFFGMMPKDMYENSTLYGVEIDDISARIAKMLYPKAKIMHKGFEGTDLFNDFYDLVISNVPFGTYKVNDPAYNQLNLSIHDYFICKAVDKARSGGFIIVITEHNTLDRNESKAREYINERAQLIGAVRFPNNVFGDAHTKVVSDLLVLRKKSNGEESSIKFVDSLQRTREYTKKSLNLVLNYHCNQYFSDHPENILGTETVVSGQYHDILTVEGDLDVALLNKRLSSLAVKYEKAQVDDSEEEGTILLPDELESTPNYAFVIHQGKIWYRVNGLLKLHTPKNKMAETRLRAMLPIRDQLLKLYDLMKSKSATDEAISEQQKHLEQSYDYFVQKYGFFTKRANELAFSEDSKYPLLCALEVFDSDTGEYKGKAEVFTKRTVRIETEPKADNAYDALQISLAQKGMIDFAYMAELTAIDEDSLKKELIENYQLFKLPEGGYADSHTYLSGYVKDKLRIAKAYAENDDSFKRNVEALEKVQPKDVPAHEIFVPLGATWIPTEIYEQFMYELFKTSKWNQRNIKVCLFSDKFYISNKTNDNYRAEIKEIYGTPDVTAYELLEDTLNMISTRVTDRVETEDGKVRYVVNRDKTIAAQQKQEELKIKFSSWLFDDPDRRDRIVRLFNDTLNNVVIKEYDGSYLTFPGMNKTIELMPHQKNAVQRIIQNGNTMLAHRVGAGKTFTMIAAAMELKRLGLCNKPLFVVPNHLISQWAGEIARLYPLANILVTTKKDFAKKNRKKFCAKIATGNYDAILCSHSQFSIGMPLSKETQLKVLKQQMEEINYLLSSYEDIEYNDVNFQQKNYTERQLKLKKKTLEAKIESLMDSPHDDTVTFEDLGIDQIFIDEAHLFKNLACHTKLRNVAGLTNAVSKKAQDLYGKVLYLNEQTNYRGVVFATGTPISNAICELYVMQKYLEPQHLEKAGIISFDSWVSRFAETETKIEVKPEGTGYRSVIRCCKYHNLPELMNLFRIVADIKVKDLQLDLPEVRTHHIAVKPSDTQKEVLKTFTERAEQIRLGNVEPDEDNMLCVTNDGRKLAIDQRMYDIVLENDMKSKLNRCARTVSKIWNKTKDSCATQLVFLDMGTPKSKAAQEKAENAIFDAYNAFKSTLLSLGIAEEEIAFIHDANTDTKKIELYDKVNAGKVRILLGSTDKLGAGTNVQKRCIALHHVDCPWRPSDLDQREGRIVRPGNLNKVVHLYSYVTVNTFDTYLYQTILNKAEPISQIMSGKTPMRDMEDLDSQCLNYAEIKACATRS